MPVSSASDQANVTESIAITHPVPIQTSSRPPSAGPMNVPALSMVLVTTLAAVSCSGEEVSDGSSAVCAGWNAVETAVTSSATAYTSTAGADVHTATAAPAVAAKRTASDAIITDRRRWRSASSDRNGAATAAVVQRARASRPTAFAPPA